jgi:hypothetical protein
MIEVTKLLSGAKQLSKWLDSGICLHAKLLKGAFVTQIITLSDISHSFEVSAFWIIL